VSINKENIQEVYPLTPMQQGIYFHHLMDNGAGEFFEQASTALKGQVNIDAMKEALDEMIARNPVLRTVFQHDKSGRPLQIVLKQRAAEFVYHDLSEKTESEKEDIIERFRVSDRTKGFDLEEGPLMRFALFRRNHSSYQFIRSHHHILIDGWCSALLSAEYSKLYEAAVTQIPHNLPLSQPYSNYVRWLDKMGKETALNFWNRYLEDVERSTDIVQGKSNGKHKPSIHRLELDAATTSLLKIKASSINVTTSILCQVCWGSVLSYFTGEHDVVFGSVVSGRPPQVAGIENMIGLFINTIPFRVDLSRSNSFNEILMNAQRDSLSAEPYHYVSLAEIQSGSVVKGKLINHAVIFENFPVAQSLEEANEDQISATHHDVFEQSNYPLDVRINVGTSTGILIRYNQAVLDGDLIDAILKRFEAVLKLVAGTNDVSIQRILALNGNDEMKLESFNANDHPIGNKTVPQMILEQAQFTPNARAISSPGRNITYKALVNSASAVASLAHRCSPQPGVVAILMDRGPFFIESVLGVWLSGNSYVPIDPALPFERMRFMMNKCGAKTIITEQKYIVSSERLKWSIDACNLICVDTDVYDNIEEPLNDSKRQDLWNYISEVATNKIEAGGWFNSYTGLPFSVNEMVEYAENIFEKLAPYLAPGTKVLELGCGSGITMERLAPHVGHYYAVDTSPSVVEFNKRWVSERGFTNTTLEVMDASMLEKLSGLNFDIVIINSVVQNFNGYNYLRRVLRSAADVLSSSGVIFVGDVMDLELKATMEDSLRQFKLTNPGMRTKLDWSDELFVSKSFFYEFADVLKYETEVATSLKIGALKNELTEFRFDVLYKIDKSKPKLTAFNPTRFTLSDAKSIDIIHDVKMKDLAYVLFTSGSTGVPKGASVHHAGMLNHMMAKITDMSVNDKDVICQNASQSFDISVWQMFTALISGAQTLDCPIDVASDPDRFMDMTASCDATIVEVVPSFLAALLENIRLNGAVWKCDKLRYLMVTGEVLQPRLAEEWFRNFPNVPLINAYGPTEASDDITHFIFNKVPSTELLPVGKPIINTKIYILNSLGLRCRPGVFGEICVSGICVGNGYINDEEKTNSVFCKDPFDNERRMYHTGDWGRFRADGNVEFVRRIDNQVKIRGFRIELGEIEAVLARHPAVNEVIIVTPDHDSICAYLTMRSGPSLESTELNEYASALLPYYMVPDRFVILEKMPVLASGKVDRHALASMIVYHEATSDDVLLDGMASKLAELWRAVLDVEQIRIDDNFFHLGGHSLKATRLLSRIRKGMNVNITLRDIFNNPMLRNMADLLTTAELSSYDEITATPNREHYPLSHSQKRIWILSQFPEASKAYNTVNGWKLQGAISIDALQNAYRHVIARHESLRTVFVSIKEHPFQKISLLDPDVHSIGVIDLTHHQHSAARASEIIHDFSSRLFDMVNGPLIRALCIKIAENRYNFFICVHHSIVDGWSYRILLRELLQCYDAFEKNHVPELEPLPIQFRDYAVWQNKQLSGTRLEYHKNYWLNQLSGDLPILQLPTSKDRPERQTFTGRVHNKVFDRKITTSVRKLALEENTTLFTVLVASAKALFHLYTGDEDIIVGTSVAGRVQKELEDQIGFFVNNLALRTKFSHRDRFSKLLARVRDVVLSAFEHQIYPFEQLVDDVNPVRDLRRSPFFDVLIELQNYQQVVDMSQSLNAMSGLSIGGYPVDTGTSIFDLNLEFRESTEDLALVLRYNSDVFTDEEVAAMTDQFELVVMQVCEDRDITVDNIKLCTDRDIELIESFNPPRNTTTDNLDLGSLFLERVRLKHDAVAYSYQGQSFTFEDIEKCASKLSALIEQSSIPKQSVVAVLMDRSPTMAATIMGIWKAGMIYIPIEPSMPTRRMQYILRDAYAMVIVSERKYYHEASTLHSTLPKLNYFVCSDSNNIDAEIEPELESMKRDFWEFQTSKNGSPHHDIVSGAWINSFTGNYFSREEMDEYAINVALKLTPHINSSTRILEIGVASGITMFRIATMVAHYTGVDLSAKVLEENDVKIKSLGLLNISQHCLFAHEIDQLDEESFDVIIINSVIQNFNGVNYLTDVINKCLSKLAPQGLIFIGDVPDVTLKEQLENDIVRFHKEQGIPGQNFVPTDGYNFYASTFFEDLPYVFPSVSAVEVSSKIFTISNELTKYRFDVMLQIDKTNRSSNANLRKKYRFDNRDLSSITTTDTTWRFNPDDAAYVIYTSGSTGDPKGAVIEHKGMLNHLYAKIEDLSITDSSVIAQNASQSFDISIWQLFAALPVGARTVIYSNELVLSASDFIASTVVDGITILEVVPSYLAAVLEIGERDPISFGLSLQNMVVTGEIVHPLLVKRWLGLYPNVQVVNAYGPTEASDDITHYIIKDAKQIGSSVPVGKPVRNMKIYVLNDRGNICPIGVWGEICVTGIGVGRGYLGRPDLTRKVFRKHVFANEYRMYHTGDNGRFLPDGTIQFQGRKDEQIKLHGYRIELGEIEYRLMSIPQVRQAAVVVDNAEGDEQLVAHIVLQKNTTLGAAHIATELRRALPEYMIPIRFSFLEELPLTVNGKIDRKKLKTSFVPVIKDPVEELLTETEKKLGFIWQQILEKENIGATSNFFQIGGHSLKGIRVMARIAAVFQLRLTLKVIFEYPTIRSLALEIDSQLMIRTQDVAAMENDIEEISI
jgi:amino acid adenylation domain-containing protein